MSYLLIPNEVFANDATIWVAAINENLNPAATVLGRLPDPADPPFIVMLGSCFFAREDPNVDRGGENGNDSKRH